MSLLDGIKNGVFTPSLSYVLLCQFRAPLNRPENGGVAGGSVRQVGINWQGQGGGVGPAIRGNSGATYISVDMAEF